jgi:hypothetical protein
VGFVSIILISSEILTRINSAKCKILTRIDSAFFLMCLLCLSAARHVAFQAYQCNVPFYAYQLPIAFHAYQCNVLFYAYQRSDMLHFMLISVTKT